MKRGSFVLAILLATPAQSATLRVPEDVATITQALSQAADGDVIEVAPGTYSPATGEGFPLRITADVALSGAGMGATVVDAAGAGSVVELDTPVGGRVSGMTLTGGAALRGGGIHVMRGAPVIQDNLIRANGAMNAGSGIHATGQSVPYIHHNVVWSNYDLDLEDPGDPHGIQILESDAIVEHNVVGRHDSNGLIVHANSNPRIANNIFIWNGIEGLRGRGICHFGGPATEIVHNLFFENVIAALLVDGAGDISGDEANALAENDAIFGNLDQDPELIDPDGGDWHLAPASPAIDAGDPASPPDPDGTLADIGAFYFHQTTAAGEAGVVAVAPRLLAAPNPTPARTAFEVASLPAGRITAVLYDASGRRLTTLAQRDHPGGRLRLEWGGRVDGVRQAAGVYWVKLSQAERRWVASVILLP